MAGSWRKVLLGKTASAGSNVTPPDLAANPQGGKYLKVSSGVLEWAGIEAGGEVSMSRIALGADNYGAGNILPFGYRYDENHPQLAKAPVASIEITSAGSGYVPGTYTSVNNGAQALTLSAAHTHYGSSNLNYTPIVHDDNSLTINYVFDNNGSLTSCTVDNPGSYGAGQVITGYFTNYMGGGETTQATIAITLGTPELIYGVADVNGDLVEAHRYDTVFSGVHPNRTTLVIQDMGGATGDLIVVDDDSSPFKGPFIVEKLNSQLGVLRNVTSAMSEDGLSYNLQVSVGEDDLVDTTELGFIIYNPVSSNMTEVDASIIQGSKDIAIADTTGIQAGAQITLHSGSGLSSFIVSSVVNSTTFTVASSASATGPINISISSTHKEGSKTRIAQPTNDIGLNWIEHADLIQFRGTDNQITTTLSRDVDAYGASFSAEMNQIKLSLPQDIAAGSTPSFTGIQLTNDSAISKDKKLQFDAVGTSDTPYIQSPTGSVNKLLITAPKTGSSIELTSETVAVSGDMTVSGDMIINGTTTTLNTTTVEVEDNILQLNTTQAFPNTATAPTSGISIYRGDAVALASLIFDDSNDTWGITNNLNVVGKLTATELDLNGNSDFSGNLTLSGDNATAVNVNNAIVRLGTIDNPTKGIQFNWDRGANASLNGGTITTIPSNNSVRATLSVSEHLTSITGDVDWLGNSGGQYPEIFNPTLSPQYDSVVTGDVPTAFLQLKIEESVDSGNNWTESLNSNSVCGIQFGKPATNSHTVAAMYSANNNLYINSFHGVSAGNGYYERTLSSGGGAINLGFSGGVYMYGNRATSDAMFALTLEGLATRGNLDIYQQSIGAPDINARLNLYASNAEGNKVSIVCPATINNSYSLILPASSPSNGDILEWTNDQGMTWISKPVEYTHPTSAGNEHLPPSVSQTEAGYLSGVTSDIQTQINNKLKYSDSIPVFFNGTLTTRTYVRNATDSYNSMEADTTTLSSTTTIDSTISISKGAPVSGIIVPYACKLKSIRWTVYFETTSNNVVNLQTFTGTPANNSTSSITTFTLKSNLTATNYTRGIYNNSDSLDITLAAGDMVYPAFKLDSGTPTIGGSFSAQFEEI